MSTQNPRSQKSCSGRTLGCGLAIGGVFLITLFVVAFILIRAQSSGKVITAWITAPVTNQQVEVNQPLTILAGAAYPSGMSRVEVYADGALILANDTTGQGETELNVTGIWTPLTTGSHILLARGYAGDDSYADSDAVYVDVTETPESITVDVDSFPGEENPSLDILAQYLGTTPEELARRNPGLNPSGPLPSGSRVEAPHPPSSPSTSSSPPERRSGAPDAPTGASGTADCTRATLSWAATPGAQSYRVYRIGARRELRVDGLRSTTYTDTLSGRGIYRYQIAAVRNGREGPSATITVSNLVSCPAASSPPGTADDLVLTAAMVDTDSVWEGIYCYISVNGGRHNHIPEGDSRYQPPEAANNKYYNLTRLPGGGRVSLSGSPLTSSVTFFSECWGRRGPNSTFLGSFLVIHPQAEWDGRLRTASGGAYRFTYCLGPSSTPCTPEVPEIARLRTSSDLSGVIVSLVIPPPTNLRRTASSEACGDLSNWFDRFLCSIERRQTVFWDWTATTAVPESSLAGYTVQRTLYDRYSGARLMTNRWDVNRTGDGSLPKRFLSEDRDLHCGQRVMYRVLARTAELQSELSDPISFETERCTTGANVTLTFDTLQVGAVNDTHETFPGNIPIPARIADLEIEGYIYATDARASTLASQILPSGRTDESHIPNAYTLGAGTFRWSTLVNINSFNTFVDNNTQTLAVGVQINEVDTEPTRSVMYNTPWCVANLVFRARSLEEWSSLNLPFTLTGGTSEASCTITGRAVGTPIR